MALVACASVVSRLHSAHIPLVLSLYMCTAVQLELGQSVRVVKSRQLEVKKHNLAVRNDMPAGRWEVDGWSAGRSSARHCVLWPFFRKASVLALIVEKGVSGTD